MSKWDKTKKDLQKQLKTPAWVFMLIGLAFIVTSIFWNVVGASEGYYKGYNEALEHEESQSAYLIYLDYDFEQRKEMFWSTIMWDVASNTKTIFIAFTLVAILWAITR